MPKDSLILIYWLAPHTLGDDVLHGFPNNSLLPVRTPLTHDPDSIYLIILEDPPLDSLDLARIQAIKESIEDHVRRLRGLQEVNITFGYIVLVVNLLVLSTARKLRIVG